MTICYQICKISHRRSLSYKAKSLVKSLADARQLLTTNTIGPCIRPLREYL